MTNKEIKNNVVDILSQRTLNTKPWWRKKEEVYETCSSMPKSRHAVTHIYELSNLLIESMQAINASLCDDVGNYNGKEFTVTKAPVDLSKLPVERQRELSDLLDKHNRRTMIFCSKVEELVGLTPDSEMMMGCWPGELCEFHDYDRKSIAKEIQALTDGANEPIKFEKPTNIDRLITEYFGEDWNEGPDGKPYGEESPF